MSPNKSDQKNKNPRHMSPYTYKPWGYVRHYILDHTPGMRVFKTVIGLIITLVIGYYRSSDTPFQAAVAMVVCLRPSLGSTKEAALNRMMGTLIAGIYAYLFITIFESWLLISTDSLLYYLLVGFFSLPLMIFIIKINKTGATTITVIVYLIISLNNQTDVSPILFATERVIETLVGIAVAVFVNWLPQLNQLEHFLNQMKWQDRRRFYITKNKPYIENGSSQTSDDLTDSEDKTSDKSTTTKNQSKKN